MLIMVLRRVAASIGWDSTAVANGQLRASVLSCEVLVPVIQTNRTRLERQSLSIMKVTAEDGG